MDVLEYTNEWVVTITTTLNKSHPRFRNLMMQNINNYKPTL